MGPRRGDGHCKNKSCYLALGHEGPCDLVYSPLTYVEHNRRGGRSLYTSEWEREYEAGREEGVREQDRLERLIREGTSTEILVELKRGTIVTPPATSLGPFELQALFEADIVLLNNPGIRKAALIREVYKRMRRVRGVAGALRRLLPSSAGRGARPENDPSLVSALNEALKRERRERGRTLRGSPTSRERVAAGLGVHEGSVGRMLKRR